MLYYLISYFFISFGIGSLNALWKANAKTSFSSWSQGISSLPSPSHRAKAAFPPLLKN
jgi:hypothetical protein